MRRYDTDLFKEVEDVAADAFIADLLKVYKKHNMSLSHEDRHGMFEIVRGYEAVNIQRLFEAMVRNPEKV